MSNKDKYIQFCTEHSDIPIFSQPWWLDAVCFDNWDVILIERNSKIIASFPYCKNKTYRMFTHIGMPPLTQKLGPYIVYDSNMTTENKKIGYEHEIYNDIIDKLPKCDSLAVNFDWKYKNWLSFYWRGYRQTTRYTYILNEINNYDYIFKNFAKNKKQKIQKTKNILNLKFDLSPEAFYAYFSDTIFERCEKVSFSEELFYRLYNVVYTHQAGRTFYCTDNEDNIHAINFMVWDKECAYYLIAMRKKEYNTSGGTEYLVNETIKYVSQFVNRFDFEGSMIKGVEESFRYFGSHQTEYYSISKCNNPILKVLRFIKK